MVHSRPFAQVLSHRSGRKLSLPRCKKGTMADPNNYRPISLLSTTYKRFAWILQKRLKAVDEAYKKDGKFLPWLYSQNQPLRLGLRRRHRHLYRRSGAGTTDSAHAAGGGSARQPFPELEKSVLLRSTTASNHIQFLTGEGMKTATQAKYLGVMLWSDSPSKTGVITRLATYNAMFVPMLSYGMESAALTAAHLDRLEATHSHPPGTVKVVWPCIWEQPQATWKGTVFLRRRCLQGWYCKVMDKAVPE